MTRFIVTPKGTDKYLEWLDTEFWPTNSGERSLEFGKGQRGEEVSLLGLIGRKGPISIEEIIEEERALHSYVVREMDSIGVYNKLDKYHRLERDFNNHWMSPSNIRKFMKSLYEQGLIDLVD